MSATQVIRIKTTVSKTRTKKSSANNGSKKKGNPNRCPTCGRYR